MNGTSGEIHLSSENAQALRSSLGQYTEHARNGTGGPPPKGASLKSA